MDVMGSVTVADVSAYPVGPSLDVCPPVQEDLNGPEVAFLSSTVEGSPSILSKTQTHNTKIRKKHDYSHHTYIVTSIYSYMHVYILYTIPRIKNY